MVVDRPHIGTYDKAIGLNEAFELTSVTGDRLRVEIRLDDASGRSDEIDELKGWKVD